MNKLIKKKHFVGVDISKDTLDFAVLEEETNGKYKEKRIQKSIKGWDSIQEWIDKKGIKIEDCHICLEHTGTYGLLVFARLSQLGVEFCVEPGLQIKRSIGITRGKKDKVDARRITEYCYTSRAKLKLFKKPSVLVLQIKQQLTYRDQAIRIRTSLKNSLKSHKQNEKVSG